MPKLLKRDKAPKQEATPEVEETVPAPVAETEPVTKAEPEVQPEPVAPPTETAPAMSGSRTSGNGGGSSAGPGGLIGRIYGDPGEMSRAERDRQAALEFEQAVAPVMDLLVASVPEASTPEEAARAWESRAGDTLPDPGAGAYIPGDSYDEDARVYYRLLRRDYEKNPRPSLRSKNGVTHHLHSQYNRLPGIKGW